MSLQLRYKIESLEKEIENLEKLIKKVDGIWDPSMVEKKRITVDEKIQKIENCTCKLERNTDSDKRTFNHSVALKAKQLAEDNRLTRRGLGSGTKRKLDSETEDFIASCIEEKGEAHGWHADSVIYGCKRFKYDDLLDVTNKHLASRNKPLIKSKSTIQLISRPRNKRSIQARLHHGRALFCTRKPSKSGCVSPPAFSS